MTPNVLRGISHHVVVDPEVRGALDEGVPLVALESSPIAFGWERDRSLNVLSSSIEAIVDRGALPAVFWVEGGSIRVSADRSTVGQLAGDRDVLRVSRGTLANALLSGRIGATTISATMMMAHAVGIPTLAVGGIGGVHLGAFGTSPTLDVSPDIDELSRTPMIVISSGPKIILDVAGTLEILETRGVPIVSIGTPYVPGYFVEVTERLAPITVATHKRQHASPRCTYPSTPGPPSSFAYPSPPRLH